MRLLLIFILVSGICFGQSKKKNIEALKRTIDSLYTIVQAERVNNLRESAELKSSVDKLSKEIIFMKDNFSGLTKINNDLNEEIRKLKKELTDIKAKNLALEAKLKAFDKEREIYTSDFKFNLIASNKRDPPAASIQFVADYLIEFKQGIDVIAVFEDLGEGFISKEHDYVSIRSGYPSERVYAIEKTELPEYISVVQTFIIDGELTEVWKKTYKKGKADSWFLYSCKGECD